MSPLVEPAPGLEPQELDRYSRHILLPELGEIGQRRLKNARVLVVGAGGLGSPVLLYLAAAGVGTIGIVDDDRVEASNLQRQVVHGVEDVGRLKVESARDALRAINPLVRVETHPVRLTTDNAGELFARHDLVVDGADNFATRYLVSDAAELAGKPVVWGSILRFGAQVSVFWSAHGPTYRDLYPDAPPPESAPSCGEAGVLGMLCGVAGSMMAAEAVKLITGSGRSLLGRLSVFDLADATWRELRVVPDPARRPASRLEPAPDACAVEAAPRSLDVHELAGLLHERTEGRAAFDLIDVREPDEVALARIPGSRSVPLSRLRREGVLDGIPRESRIVLYCKAGPRARAAASLLRETGYTDVRVFDGGMDEWGRAARAAS
ncbi:molybdopterin-synthase adenylyltransferase MoeB [Microbacterium sp. X-17]|uniref:molybdopterin-synthase adenylyltransferase MoeB n=1 Tax=Microbacterium sp. X-17 TaxID=3144404 RepID=UPI0031F5AC97